jgi:predicted nucleotidyltransferase
VKLTKQQISSLKKVFETFPDIEAAYLFGSYAEGAAKPDSDIDIGLCGNYAKLSSQLLDILTKLTVAGFDKVDIVLLDMDDLVMKFEVIHHNQLLYSVPGFDHGTLFSRTLREYWDLQPILDYQRQAMKERLING